MDENNSAQVHTFFSFPYRHHYFTLLLYNYLDGFVQEETVTAEATTQALADETTLAPATTAAAVVEVETTEVPTAVAVQTTVGIFDSDFFQGAGDFEVIIVEPGTQSSGGKKNKQSLFGGGKKYPSSLFGDWGWQSQEVYTDTGKITFGRLSNCNSLVLSIVTFYILLCKKIEYFFLVLKGNIWELKIYTAVSFIILNRLWISWVIFWRRFYHQLILINTFSCNFLSDMFPKQAETTPSPKQVKVTTESVPVETYAHNMHNPLYKLVRKPVYNPLYNPVYRLDNHHQFNSEHFPPQSQFNFKTQSQNVEATKPTTAIPEIAPNTFFGIFDFFNKEKEKPERPEHEHIERPTPPPRKD